MAHALRQTWWRRRELRWLVLALATVTVAWGAFAILNWWLAGDVNFDQWAVRALRRGDDASVPVGPAWLPEVARNISALGSHVVTLMLVAGVTGYMVLRGKRMTALVMLIGAAGGVAINAILKQTVTRARPDISHFDEVVTGSFPSGHALLAALVYVALAAMLASIEPRPLIKAYVIGIGLALSALVGLSRVYLGVHYPSDVLAGWTLALIWALVCWLGAKRMHQQRSRLGRKADA
jgi:undecaprenyl-diphosphatase